jgi:hypothetical protein
MLLLFLVLLASLGSVQSTLLWKKPEQEYKVLHVPEPIFRQKTIDTYSIETGLETRSSSSETFNHSNNIEDPYKGSGQTSFALMGNQAQIKIIGLDGKEVKTVSDIYVECYDYNDCDYTLTEKDLAYLTLYASFIDNSGFTSISEEFSLGLIRSKYSQSLMGMYTEGFTETTNHKAFWIRLWKGGRTASGSEHLYDQLGSDVAKTVAVLELAVHERSHYDKPNFDSAASHCSEFQVNYNSLIQRAYRSLHKYEHITQGQLRATYLIEFPWIIVATTFILLGIVLVLIAFQ